MTRRLALLLFLAACARRGPPDAVPRAEPPLPDLPEVGAPAPWAVPTPTRHALPGGVTLHLLPDATLPLVSLRLLLPTGAGADAVPGTTALAAAMLEESAGGRSTLEQAAALDRLAARFSVTPDREWTVVALDVHRDRLDAALPLVADALLRPAFVREDWERVHARHLHEIRQGLQDNGVIAGTVGPMLLFGPDHPYGKAVDGTLAQAERVTLDAVRRWHAARVRAAGAVFVVAGDVREDEVQAAIARSFSRWPAGPPVPPPAVSPPTPRPGIWLVDVPGATQTMLWVAHPGPAGDADAEALELARIVLGGSFTSRLNQELRERKGYTYGARSSVRSYLAGGIVTATAKVRADATGAALRDLLAVLDGAVAEGFTDDERGQARALARAAVVDGVERVAGTADTITAAIRQGRNPQDLAGKLDRIEAVDLAGMQAVLARHADPVRATILLVGDRASVAPQLAEAGFADWGALDREGQPVR